MKYRSSGSKLRKPGPTLDNLPLQYLPPQAPTSSTLGVAIGVSYCCGPAIQRLESVVTSTAVEDCRLSVQMVEL